MPTLNYLAFRRITCHQESETDENEKVSARCVLLQGAKDFTVPLYNLSSEASRCFMCLQNFFFSYAIIHFRYKVQLLQRIYGTGGFFIARDEDLVYVSV